MFVEDFSYNQVEWVVARLLIVSWGARVRRVGAAQLQVGLARAVCPESTDKRAPDDESGFDVFHSQGEWRRSHCQS